MSMSMGAIPSTTRPARVPHPDAGRWAARRTSFAARYGVRPFKLSDANLVKFLRSSRGDPGILGRWERRIRHLGWDHGTFDHGELWGRDGHSFFLIGQPYCLGFGLPHQSMGTLSDLHALGFGVTIDGLSWYGHSTLRILVSHPAVGAWPVDPARRDPECKIPADFDAAADLATWRPRP